MTITNSEVRNRLNYNPTTGAFTWLPKQVINKRDNYWNIRYAGTSAGSIGSHGYFAIHIQKKLYLSHRLVWLYMTGEWPLYQIDHINMIRTDNRFANLRPATRSQNYTNRISYKNSTHGFKGIYFHKASGSWHATVMRNRKKISLGYYRTPELAHQAYTAFTLQEDGEFART